MAEMLIFIKDRMTWAISNGHIVNVLGDIHKDYETAVLDES